MRHVTPASSGAAGARRVLAVLLGVSIALASASSAHAATYALEALFANAGFETGLTGWTYTGAGVNANTYLTNAEWAAGTWSSSSPYTGYTDANLAVYYPGKPWGLNPNITHIDQTCVGCDPDPTVTLNAAIGTNFVGSRQDGYEGHYRRDPSEPAQPSTPTTFIDTNWQLTSGAIAGPFTAGDKFTLTIWANRGRTKQDWGQQNGNTAGSASSLNIRLVGGTYSQQTFDFTSWAKDGQWAFQSITWTLTSSPASIQIQVTAQNKNHHRYVAYDAGPVVTPVKASTWGRIKTLYR